MIEVGSVPRVCVGRIINENFNKMTKQDFNRYLDDLTTETGFDLSKEQKAFAYQAAKEYHSRALRIHDVVGRSEQLKCEHKGRRTATELVEYCEDCKKILFHP